MTQDQGNRALLTAFAQDPSPTALGPALASLSEWVTYNTAAMREAGHTYAAELACDLGEQVMKRKHRRNVGQFAPRKAARAFRAVLPSWALAAFTVCLAIPGPLDEAVAFVAALVLLVVRFPRARSAWRGGKTHRTTGKAGA